jgi:hypothetical protein
MFNKNKFFVVAMILFAAVFAAKAQKAQTVFNLEEDFRKEVAVPEAVIAVLKSDERVDACFREKGEGANENAWFSASEIDLNGDRRMDLIIKAKDGCLFGANQGPFWIFQKRSDGYQQVLSASGLQLAVLPKKVNSFSQIKISKVVSMKPSSVTYSFKGGKYQ